MQFITISLEQIAVKGQGLEHGLVGRGVDTCYYLNGPHITKKISGILICMIEPPIIPRDEHPLFWESSFKREIHRGEWDDNFSWIPIWNNIIEGLDMMGVILTLILLFIRYKNGFLAYGYIPTPAY